MDPPAPKPEPEPPEPEPDDSEAAPAESEPQPELSPAVARRVQLSLKLEEVLSRRSPEIDAAHAELFAAVLGPGERPPDVQAPLECYGRVMATLRRKMVATDLAHSAGLEKVTTLVSDRELMIAAISKRMARTRRRCSGWFGRDALGALGLAGPLAKGRSAIYEQGREAACRLRSYTPGDDPQEDHDSPSLKSWLTSLAAKLDGELDTLELTVGELAEEREQNDVRFDRRKKAIAEFDPRYLSIGSLAEAVLRLIGQTEEADRIHPSTRQLDRDPDDET